MKLSFLLFLILASFNLMAKESQRGRAPAVVPDSAEDECNPNFTNGSESFFSKISHKVIIHADDELGCSVLPNKRYIDSDYEENARNEMKINFQKYSGNYSKKCTEYFKQLKLKNGQFVCETPEIISITFSDFNCEKQVEDGTHKVSYASSATAIIEYEQTGKKLVDKSAKIVQSARVNKCIEKTASTTKVPRVESNSSFFDGNRESKINPNPNIENQEENPGKNSAKK